MRMSALFGIKKFEFFEMHGVSARTRGGGWASVDKWWGGQFFSILCGRFFMDGPIYAVDRHGCNTKAYHSCWFEIVVTS